MKILCVIDHFGTGGAQRQMVNLARGLKDKGHAVEMFIYFLEFDFFRQQIEEAGIPVHEVRKGCGFSFRVLSQLVRLLRANRYEGVISFLGSPNAYAILAGLMAPATKIVVSERSSYLSDKVSNSRTFVKNALYVAADCIVANSHDHAASLLRHSWLRKKVFTIYNGYSLEPSLSYWNDCKPLPSLLVIGRIGPEKNALRLIEALKCFGQKHGYLPTVSWAGKEDQSPTGSIYCQKLHAALDGCSSIKDKWQWLGECNNIPELLQRHSALMHPSLYEGLPNAVCEALIAGRPVLASNVCDHPLLVEDGVRGFLFDPLDPQSIADAMARLFALTDEEERKMSVNARRYAEDALRLDRMVSAYESLLAN